jgi:hypothetical protein
MTHSAGQSWDANARHGCVGRKRWSAWEIIAIVAGFIVFWPLGLLALFVKLWNGELWPGAAAGDMPWKPTGQGWNWQAPSWTPSASRSSGNAAFEDYKKRELERLEAERRKLMDEQKAFAEFVERVRRAKDQEEFDRFMAERNAPKDEAQPS